MARAKPLQTDEAEFSGYEDDLCQVSAGQSGGSQGLSRTSEAPESVEELADSGQALEADAVSGFEDAADHPERPVRTHQEARRARNVPADKQI